MILFDFDVCYVVLSLVAAMMRARLTDQIRFLLFFGLIFFALVFFLVAL